MRTIAVIANDAFSLVNFRGPLIAEMASRGVRVIAMAPHFTPELRERVCQLGAQSREIPLDRIRLAPLRDLVGAIRLAQILRKENVTDTFSYFLKPILIGNIAAFLAGVPRRTSLVAGLGYVFTDVGPGKASLRKRVLRRCIELALGLAFSLSRQVFLQNEADRAYFVDRKLLAARKAVLVAGTGVDIDHYHFAPLPQGKFRALFVGRLLREKGVRELIAAARILRDEGADCTIALAGGIDSNPGALAEKEIRQSVDDGLCEWLGNLSNLRPELERSHVFVLPSYREGKPRSTQEALAMGRPVITTDTVGCRETVDPGVNGWLVPVGDAPALARAIADSMTDYGRLVAMGKESRRLAEERFDVTAINDAMLERMEIPRLPLADREPATDPIRVR